jgi:hypothetical protein
MSPFKDMTMVRNSILGGYHHPFLILPRSFTPGETFADAGSISRYDGTRWCIIRGWNRTSISKPLMTCSIRLGMECLLRKMTKTRGSSNEESDNDIVVGAFYRLQTARGELCEKPWYQEAKSVPSQRNYAKASIKYCVNSCSLAELHRQV